MDLNGFLKAITSVSGPWTLAAYSIAAVLAVGNLAVSRGRKSPPSSIVWGLVVVVCVLGLVPTLANAYLEHERIVIGAVYHVRVLVVNPQQVPVSGAILRTTASNETTETNQGIGQITIPRATMPADGKITIYADLGSEYLHGQTLFQLKDDLNPSIRIELKANGDAVISGFVEDNTSHAVAGATVSVLGGSSGVTDRNGIFTLKANAAVGQPVRLHVEKDGYEAVDQDHPAGREPATIVLNRTPSVKKKVQR